MRTPRNVHVVSLVHSTVIVYLAATKLFNPALDEDRAFGWENSIGITAGIASGCVHLHRWISGDLVLSIS